MNFMFLHSTSVHILLAVYPMMLFAAGDIRPSAKGIGKSLLLLLMMAVPIYAVNCLLDTNFMFLMYAPDGNPLAWFRDRFGSHWIGFPVLLAAVGGGKTAVLTKIKERQPLISGPAALFRAFCLDERAGFCYF